MKVLVTGATGFIGTHLHKALIETGNEIVCAVRKTSNVDNLMKKNTEIIVVNDFFNQSELDNLCKGIEIVIHLIGQLGVYGVPYDEYDKTNIQMVKKLLKSCSVNSVKQFIFCSTPGVVGFGKRYMTEEDDCYPRNFYGKSKMIAEQTIKEICDKDPTVKYTILRPDFVYGPGDLRRIKMYKGIQNKQFVLTTSGKTYLHPTYIDDVVQGFLLCLGNEKAYNETFNIAAEKDEKVIDYLNSIATYTGSKIVHINISRPLSVCIATIVDKAFNILFRKEGFVSKSKIDFLSIDHSSSIVKAQNLLGYKPKYDCSKGMQMTIEWFQENGYLK